MMPPEHTPASAVRSVAGDPLDGVQRLQDRLHVGVQPPVGVPGVRVAPGDHEHLLALPHEVLDQAPARGQVQRVVLVDRRRHDQQRDLAGPSRSAACTG